MRLDKDISSNQNVFQIPSKINKYEPILRYFKTKLEKT